MIKILTGVLSPLSGIVHRNAKLRIAVFSQHHIDQLDLRSNSVQFLARMFPGMPDEEYRRQLGAFGITGTTSLQKIATLSGGQRSRVAFAMMSLMRPHFLIFDEPTVSFLPFSLSRVQIQIRKRERERAKLTTPQIR